MVLATDFQDRIHVLRLRSEITNTRDDLDGNKVFMVNRFCFEIFSLGHALCLIYAIKTD